MKRTIIALLLVNLVLSACAPVSAPTPTPAPSATPLPTATATPTNVPMSTTSPASTPSDLKTFIPLVEKSYRTLPPRVSWQIQYTGEIDISLDVDVFNLDLFDTTPDVIDTLHQRGVFVICYFSAGSYEDWRPDSSQFPTEVLGKDLEGWPGEKWLDIRRLDLLAPIMEARLDLAVQKGCDGVDPDNVNGYTNDTGFPLTYDDQITYNVFLAQAAHLRGLAIGLKNDLEQVPDLLPYFDWILNEECFTYQECDQLLPFIQAGKPVFVIEYELTPPEFCPQANQMGFNALHKHWELDAYRTDCREFSSFESRIYSTAALHIADYLLSQQDTHGAIPDAPGWDTVNQDSNMEYALIGLAAAYEYSRDPRYLIALEKGIRWLAAREDITDPLWRGSWFYAYASTPPYAPISVPLSDDILGVRGVDATSALFVYLLYLHSVLSDSNALALEYEPNARAALDFLLANNYSPDGFFYSSWHLWQSDNRWHLWPFRYAADQGDVYLGMQAGWLLYGDERYHQVANFLRDQVPAHFFDSLSGRYALGLYEDNSMEPELDGFNGIFPQGYLAWVLGDNPANQRAYEWLSACVQSDGSLACFPGDPRYSLSASIYAMPASSLNQPLPTRSLNWLLATAYDSTDGGVRDTADPISEKFSNVAGFAIVALLQFPPFP